MLLTDYFLKEIETYKKARCANEHTINTAPTAGL